MNEAGIPIIGRTREWKSIGFVAQPMIKQQSVVVPGVVPEIIGWQFGFIAERSDGVPVQLMNVVDVSKITDDPVMKILRMIQMTTKKLGEYLTCQCQPTAPCALHRQQAQGKPS